MTEESLASLLKEGSATPGSSGSAGEGDADDGGLKTDNVRLRQEVARLEGLSQQSVPYVEAIRRLAKTKLGEKVIDKLQKGENVDDLLPKEVRELEKAVETQGVSKEELEVALKDRDQKLTGEIVEGVRVQQDAREGVQQLHNWAKGELPGFDKIEGSPTWRGALSAVQHAMREGTLAPAEKEDPWQFLYKRAYNMCVAEDPEIARGVKKAAPKTPEERLAGIVSTESKPTASSSEIDEANIPDHYKRQLEHIRKLKGGAGPTGIGLSFSNPSSNKK